MVGAKVLCQTSDLSRKSGITVVIMCITSKAIAIRVNRGMRNAIPIIISNIPKYIRNVSEFIKGMVLSSSESTIGLAGLASITLSRPNQKNIINIERRANGRNTLLIYFKCITHHSF